MLLLLGLLYPHVVGTVCICYPSLCIVFLYRSLLLLYYYYYYYCAGDEWRHRELLKHTTPLYCV